MHQDLKLVAKFQKMFGKLKKLTQKQKAIILIMINN
jgi:hypothetical protein